MLGKSLSTEFSSGLLNNFKAFAHMFHLMYLMYVEKENKMLWFKQRSTYFLEVFTENKLIFRLNDCMMCCASHDIFVIVVYPVIVIKMKNCTDPVFFNVCITLN